MKTTAHRVPRNKPLRSRRPELRLGRIIWADLTDLRGNIKCRPCIVISRTDEIAKDEPFVVMAISTSYPSPPPLDHVELPWHPDRRRVITGLNRRSAAVITWLRWVHAEDVVEFAGDVPPPLLAMILARILESDPD